MNYETQIMRFIKIENFFVMATSLYWIGNGIAKVFGCVSRECPMDVPWMSYSDPEED